jgi:threonyl-tRNA synthetase
MARAKLADAGLRVEVDGRQEKIGFKIREAQLQKIPYMLVAGDRESAEGTLAVRSRADGEIGAWAIDQFAGWARAEIESKGRQTVKALTPMKVEWVEHGGPESAMPRR